LAPGRTGNRDDFSAKVKAKLSERVGGRCSNPTCPKLRTTGPQLNPEGSINIGVAAHITAAAPGGARYNPSLTAEQRTSAENGIWLCGSCSLLIDRDVEAYPEPKLRKWKADAEAEALAEVEGRHGLVKTIGPYRAWILSVVASLIGLAVLLISPAETLGARGDRYPIAFDLTYVVGRGFVVAPPEVIAPSGDSVPILSGRDIDANAKPGTYFRDCDECPLMVVMPPGEYVMGVSPGDELAEQDEYPDRRVKIGRKFALSVYETTFREWDYGVAAGALARANDKGEGAAGDMGWGRGNRPVILVTYDQAEGYVQWLNRELGKPVYRLPSEAEWEYAARSGAETRYPLGNRYNSDLVSDGPNQTMEVGSYPPNKFGLYDMQGNVWEWTADCWHPNYRGAPRDQAAWKTGSDCTRHAIRGGSWGKEPTEMRVSNRYPSGGQGPRLGFRVARELD